MRPLNDESNAADGAESVQTAQAAQPARSNSSNGAHWGSHGAPQQLPLLPSAAGLFLVILFAWWGALSVGFVFDDLPRISRAEQSIAQLWPPSAWFFGSQRPLVQLSLAINYALGGLNPWGYHLFNIGVHACNAVLLFAVVRASLARLRARGVIGLPAKDSGAPRASLSDASISLLIAVVWALHPLTASAVTYVIQRAESMATFGILAASLAILSARADRRVVWMAVFAVMFALLSKPTAIAAPFVVLAVDSWVRQGSMRAAWRAHGATHVMTFACLGVLVFLGVVSGAFTSDGRLAGYGPGVAGSDSLQYASQSVRALGLYAQHVVWPSELAIDRGSDTLEGVLRWSIGWTVLAGLILAILAGLLRRAWWTVLPVVFVVLLAPTTSFVPLADVAVDHRMYLPLALVVAAVVGILVPSMSRVIQSSSRLPRIALLLACGIVLSLEVLGVAARNRTFADPIELWSEVVSQSPTHARGFINRAGALLEAGRDEEAAEDLARAQTLMPGNPTLLVNLAILDVRSGQAERAIERLDIATKGLRADPVVLGARGDALRMLGRFGEAGRNYMLAAERAPSEPMYPLLAGNAFSEDGEFARAVEVYTIAVSRAEACGDVALRASACFNLGNVHFKLGAFASAIEAYRAALAADPSHANARMWLREAEIREAENRAMGDSTHD